MSSKRVGFELFIQTALSSANLAILQNGHILQEVTWERQGSHSELLPDFLNQLLQQTELSLKSCNRIFCVNGPGSFTGARVGVTFSRALAQSLSCPVVAINSLELLLLSQQPESRPYLATLDAQKNSLFAALAYRKKDLSLEYVVKPQLMSLKGLEEVIKQPTVVSGDGIKRYLPYLPQELVSQLVLDSSSENVQLQPALEGLRHLENPDLAWHQLVPVYLKKSAPEELRSPSLPSDQT